jgi:uncharacterized protein (DUF2141 family)
MNKKRNKWSVKKGLYFLFSLLGLQLIIACAQIVNPTGGPQDTNSPQIVKSNPENFSVRYSGRGIELKFDEYVQVKDWNNQVIVSPLLNGPLTYKIKSKSIFIDWKDTLRENTTYSFNLGAAISDNNEGNALENNVFVFSTGSYLDSMQLSGTAINASDLKPLKDVLIMLYSTYEDSVPYLNKPIYFTKTKENGSFKLSNLKNGTYKIFALKDKNQNFLFDLPDESIGFEIAPIRLETDSIQALNLSLFEEDQPKVFVKKYYAEHYGKVNILFNKAAKNIEYTILNADSKNFRIIQDFSSNKDTLSLWLAGVNPDSLLLSIKINDKIDTLEIELPKFVEETELKKGKRTNNHKQAITNNLTKDNYLKRGQAFKLFFKNPIRGYNLDKIKLINENDTLYFSSMFEDILLKRFQVQYNFHSDSTYRLLLPSGCYTDIFGQENDSITYTFQVRNEDYYGRLFLKIALPFKDAAYVFQLLDEKKSIIKELFMEGTAEQLSFSLLDPGQYTFKLIEDSNKDGKWNTGNYLEKVQPEKIYLYTNPITVRSNWDLELEWKVQ